MWEYRKARYGVKSIFEDKMTKYNGEGSCPKQGGCDIASVRDSTAMTPMKVRVRTHVVLQDGAWPNGLTSDMLKAQEASLKKDWGQLNVDFDFVEAEEHTSSKYPSCIPEYDGSNVWYDAINELKRTLFDAEPDAINVLVTCQTPGSGGTLLGIGTFPWDPAAATNEGGLWMNAAHIGGTHKTYNHELGHNFGLWHTFHGVSEIFCPTEGTEDCKALMRMGLCSWACACMDPCWEPPHNLHPEYDYNNVGDFCADTGATFRHWDCTTPTTDPICEADEFTGAPNDNIMGYSPDSCINKLTPHQQARVHCWTCDATPFVVENGGCAKKRAASQSLRGHHA